MNGLRREQHKGGQNPGEDTSDATGRKISRVACRADCLDGRDIIDLPSSHHAPDRSRQSRLCLIGYSPPPSALVRLPFETRASSESLDTPQYALLPRFPTSGAHFPPR